VGEARRPERNVPPAPAAFVTAPRSLSFAEARREVLRAARAAAPERVPVTAVRGRALREDVVAPHALPPFDNSAMDGYAVRAADLSGASADAPVTLPVAEVVAAGDDPAPLPPGCVARIMTGAPLPPGADAIVPFEDCERLDAPAGRGRQTRRRERPRDERHASERASDERHTSERASDERHASERASDERHTSERARFTTAPAAGVHVRRAGADVESGEQVLAAGRELSAHDVALLASLGFARVTVGPRPRAAVVSTGDEILAAGEALRPGAIRDGNAPMLRALLEEAGCEVVSVEHAGDARGEALQAIRRALDAADVTLSVGGVSAGDFDPVKSDLAGIRGAELWRVAMKPGRPQAFAAFDGRLYFGLPGNPASVACVFEALVRPAIRRLQGFTALDRPRIRVHAGVAIESRAGRTDFVRVRLEWRDGTWRALPAGDQVSGHLMPQARAHALLVVPAAAPALEAGDPATALLLRWPDR